MSRCYEETQDAWNLSGRWQATQDAQDAGDATQDEQGAGDAEDATQDAQDAGDATQDAQGAGDAEDATQDAQDATAPYLTQGNFLLMQVKEWSCKLTIALRQSHDSEVSRGITGHAGQGALPSSDHGCRISDYHRSEELLSLNPSPD